MCEVDYHFGSEGHYHSECSKDEHLGAGHCIVLHGGFPWEKKINEASVIVCKRKKNQKQLHSQGR